jgi:C4-dicarboxylate-specific signal transduction histidine kinase
MSHASSIHRPEGYLNDSLRPAQPTASPARRRLLPRRVGVRSLLVALILLATLPVLGVVVVASLVEQERQVNRAAQDMDALGDLMASGQQQLIEGAAQLLTAVSNTPPVTGNDLRLCNQYLGRLQGHSPAYANIGIISMAGWLTCRAAPSTGDVDLRDRMYFRRALETSSLAIGEYVVGRTTGMKTINMAMPVKGDDGVTKGVAFVAVDVSRIEQKVRAIGVPEGMEVRVTDAIGTVLADVPGDPLSVGAPVGDAVVLAAIRHMHVGGVEPAADDPLQRHHVIQPVPVSGRPGLYVVVSASREAILAPAVHSLKLQVAAILLLLCAAAMAIWVLSDRLLARPFQRLVDTVRLMGQDQAAGNPPLRRSRVRELTQLQVALHRMSQTMGRRRQQRDRAMEEANAAQQGMVEILDRMSEGFLVVDEAWKLTYLNQRATDMLQKGRDDLTGENFWTLFPDEPGEPIRRVWPLV